MCEYVLLTKYLGDNDGCFSYYLQYTGNEDALKIFEGMIVKDFEQQFEAYGYAYTLDTEVRFTEDAVMQNCRLKHLFTKVTGNFKCPLTIDEEHRIRRDFTATTETTTETPTTPRITAEAVREAINMARAANARKTKLIHAYYGELHRDYTLHRITEEEYRHAKEVKFDLEAI
jgi:hypothetical protein